MQGAKTGARGKQTDGRPPPSDGLPPEVAPQLQHVLEMVRQRYLDALPIAAAIITIADDSFIDCANDQFRLLAEYDERLGERRISQIPLLRAGPIGTRLAAFLKKDDPAFQFETADGRAIGGRHFTVRFARLTILPGQPERCMISLIDKTAQIETERSLRSEMLTLGDLKQQLREQGVEDIGQVKRCYLEPDGRLSVIRRDPEGGPQPQRRSTIV